MHNSKLDIMRLKRSQHKWASTPRRRNVCLRHKSASGLDRAANVGQGPDFQKNLRTNL